MSPRSKNTSRRRGSQQLSQKTGAGSQRKTKSKSPSWQRCWPFVVGIALALVAGRVASILVLTGPWAAGLLMPWTFLIDGRRLGLPLSVAEKLPEWLLYLQFPLYGLFLSLAPLKMRWRTAVLLLLVVHLAAFAALILISSAS